MAEHWRAEALCVGEPPAVFWPANQDEGGYVDEPWDPAPARAICAACPVREPCLEAGLFEPVGIWGGLDPTERAQLRRTGKVRRRCAYCGERFPLLDHRRVTCSDRCSEARHDDQKRQSRERKAS